MKVEHPDVSGGLTLDYGDDGTDGWDRFGRVTGQTWTNAAGTTTFDDFAYTYDRASNRLTRDLSLTTGLDEKYTYDALNRLTNTERGTLSGGSITNATFEQDWSLDELGNWSNFAQDDDGDGTADLDQDRTHNDANEITGITETTGPSWIDPVHDAVGSMTLAARPGDEADANDALVLVYDAWNRLTEAYDDNDGDGQADAGELLATYEYDGQRRLVAKTVEGDPDVAYDNYYNSAWQLLEVRRAGDADPQDQYVWDLRYIDAPVVRFHDGNTDGDYDDAEDNVLYYTTDANYNVTAVIDDSGSVVERYAYDSYGAVTVLDGTTGGQTDWDTDADQVSDVANEILYSGYRYDDETGLYIIRNRIYHPTLGRFLQRDPMGYRGAMNLYQYVRSNPLVCSDPGGLWKVTLARGIHSDITAAAAARHDVLGPEPTYDGTERPDKYKECFRLGLILGSSWPDVPQGNLKFLTLWRKFKTLGSSGKELREYAARKGLLLTYESHFGSKQYWHGMAVEGLTAKQMQQRILDWILEQYKRSAKLKLRTSTATAKEAGKELGKALHTLQDLYALPHAERQWKREGKKWVPLEIVRFQAFEAQDVAKHAAAEVLDETHKERDKVKAAWDYAVGISAQFIKYRWGIKGQAPASPEEVKKWLLEGPLKMADGAQVGGSAPAYAKPPPGTGRGGSRDWRDDYEPIGPGIWVDRWAQELLEDD